MSKTTAKALLTIARVALAALLLWWVVSQVHWADHTEARAAGRPAVHRGVVSTIRHVAWAPIVAAALCTFGAAIVVSLRWRVLLAVQNVRVSARDVLKLGLVGEAFDTVMPGILGGDVVKAYYVARGRPGKERVVMSVFVDRLIGVCGFTLWAAVTLGVLWLVRPRSAADLRAAAASVALVGGAGAAALAVLLSPGLRRMLRVQRLTRRLPFARHLFAARDALKLYGRRRGALLAAAGLTFVCQTLGIASVALTGVALGLPVPWYAYCLYVPLILIIAAVPVTPGGIGVMEKLYVVYLAGAAGPTMGLALAVMARLVAAAPAIPGALIYALGPRLPEADAVRAELAAES